MTGNEVRFTICQKCFNYYETGTGHECAADPDEAVERYKKEEAPQNSVAGYPENPEHVCDQKPDRLTDQYGMVCEVDGHLSGQKLRIEALRAASRVIAGKVGRAPEDAFYEAFSDTSMGAAADAALTLAEQFAKWLEGER